MYVPASFVESDLVKLHDFIEQHSFATMVSGEGESVEVSHLPLLLKRDANRGELIGHMAKANSHWKSADGQPVLAIFHGPHAYISPSWMKDQNVVPTWNYVTVHVRGRMELINDRTTCLQVVTQYVENYEASLAKPWSLDELDDEFVGKLLDAIVAFRVVIESIQGKWKLSQNHTPKRRRLILQELQRQGGENAAAIAELMDDSISGRNV